MCQDSWWNVHSAYPPSSRCQSCKNQESSIQHSIRQHMTDRQNTTSATHAWQALITKPNTHCQHWQHITEKCCKYRWQPLFPEDTIMLNTVWRLLRNQSNNKACFMKPYEQVISQCPSVQNCVVLWKLVCCHFYFGCVVYICIYVVAVIINS